jgi:hypothetical protein
MSSLLLIVTLLVEEAALVTVFALSSSEVAADLLGTGGLGSPGGFALEGLLRGTGKVGISAVVTELAST